MKTSVLPFVLACAPGRAEIELDRLSAAEVKQAARHWIGKEAGPLRKAECLERLIGALRDPKRAEEVVAALRPDERAVLAVVRRFGGAISGMLLRHELLARNIVKEATPEDRGYYRRGVDPVERLCERLLLVRGHRDFSSYDYSREYPSVALPKRVAENVEPAASLEWKAYVPVEKTPETTKLRVPAQMLVELEQTARALQTQGCWRVNQGGGLSAAARNRLGKLLPDQANDPFEPPDRVALDYNILCALGVVEFDGGDGRIKPERAERLFQLPHEFQASEWIRAWMTLRIWQDGIGGVPDRDNREESTRIDPNSMRRARDLLVWTLTRIAHSRSDWLDLETFLLDIYKTMGERKISFYWRSYAWQPRFTAAVGKDKLPGGVARSRAFWMDDAGVWAANALLCTFVHLGVVERGRSGKAGSERWSFRLTEIGKAVFGAPEIRIEKATRNEKCLMIQPNHEILLYLDGADGAAVTTLGRIASRESTTGIVQSFKLTRESVYGALEGGMTPAAIESFLAARSRNGVPANVSHSLSEWSRKRDALVVRESVALGANLPEGREAVRGSAVGTRFVVASTRAAAKGAKDLRLAAESETPVRNWTVDEHGTVVTGDPVSLIGKARLRRFAGISGGTWRITPESIRGARDRGISVEQVLAWLGAHVSHEMPPVLACAIGNWADGRGKVFFGDVILLQVGDPKTFDALRTSARLRPFLKGTLAPGCLVVAADMRNDARKFLCEFGFALDAPCKLEAEARKRTTENE